jgi:hypothetical protein
MGLARADRSVDLERFGAVRPAATDDLLDGRIGKWTSLYRVWPLEVEENGVGCPLQGHAGRPQAGVDLVLAGAQLGTR